MLKLISSLPAIALLSVLMFRGLGFNAPPPEATATETDAPSLPASPALRAAIATFDDGVRGATNARAVQLFHRAQQEPAGAIAWLSGYTRTVAGDVATLRQSYGVITGEAEQYSQLLNRASELSACLLALHWLERGNIDQSKAAVNLQPIIDQIQDVIYEHAEPPAETPAG